MLNYLRLLLLPFSFIYALVVLLRNKMYDWKIFKSTEFDMPIICVGNLAVGGSGKTPTTEYLVRLLSDYKIAILSRGYGRKTKGFIVADENATAETIGDEPLQYYQKFKNIKVAVCESRVLGINNLKDQYDLIILDDAFQHRAVKAGFNILLFEYQKLTSLQFLLPAGNLRDVFSSRRRADIMVVTKSPNEISKQQAEKNSALLKPFNNQSVLHSFIKYSNLVSLFNNDEQELSSLKEKNIYLLSGIANPNPLIIELKKYTAKINHFNYPDHYAFKIGDLVDVKTKFLADNASNKIIITTEKDAKRLLSKEFEDLLLHLPIYYLPIEVDFLADDKNTFDTEILNYVKRNRRNR
jgi:tetraacyldisaccharide 4'-kinase